jgi:hypothetical protein
MLDPMIMLIGADFLRGHRAVVSAKGQVMVFTYAGGPVFRLAAP